MRPPKDDDEIIATAMCDFCEWMAQHTSGGDAIEAVTFLRRALIEHVETVHPERLTKESEARK